MADTTMKISNNPILAALEEAKELEMPFSNFNKRMRARGFVCKWNSGDSRCIMYAGDECNDPDAYFANGIVFDMQTYDVIVPCHRAHEEISLLPENLADYTIFKLYDASSIRLYFYEDSWRVCSRRCYDGRGSGWDKRGDFQKMYEDCKVDESTLNKNYIYFCLLCHPYNYVVDCGRTAELILTDIYDTRNETYIPIDSVTSPMQHVKILDAPEENYGCVIMGSDGVKRVWRDPYYAERDEMLGNWQDRRYSVIEAIKCGYIDKFLKLFPEFSETHEILRTKINEYCNGDPKRYAILFGNTVEMIADAINLNANTRTQTHQGLKESVQQRSRDNGRFSPQTQKYNLEHKKTVSVNIGSFIGAPRHMPNMNVSRRTANKQIPKE